MFFSKVESILKHSKLLLTIYRLFGSLFFRFIGLFIKIDNNLILFTSFAGLKFNDSPKALYEYIQSHPEYDKYTCIWAFINPNDYPKLKNKININSFKYFITALKAKYWVTNTNIERGLSFKKRKCIYLNTWHGFPIKTIGNSVKGRNDYHLSDINILCSDGPYFTKIAIENLGAPKKSIIECGRPREDKLFTFSKDDIERIKIKLGLPFDKKIILFVPTWRDGHDFELSSTNIFGFNFEFIKDLCKDDLFILYRGHHLMPRVNIIDINCCLDVTNYNDINDLYWISDALVSDYSSCFFDFLLLHKPVFCFSKDYETYKMTRGLYFDINDFFPYGVISNQEKLFETIRYQFENNSIDRYNELLNHFISRKGNATETCVKKLFSIS